MTDEHWRLHGFPRLPNFVTTDLAGERHRITRYTDDPRVVEVACGIRVAMIGRGHPHPVRCPKESR